MRAVFHSMSWPAFWTVHVCLDFIALQVRARRKKKSGCPSFQKAFTGTWCYVQGFNSVEVTPCSVSFAMEIINLTTAQKYFLGTYEALLQQTWKQCPTIFVDLGFCYARHFWG
jgi:hypothetical protein